MPGSLNTTHGGGLGCARKLPRVGTTFIFTRPALVVTDAPGHSSDTSKSCFSGGRHWVYRTPGLGIVTCSFVPTLPPKDPKGPCKLEPLHYKKSLIYTPGPLPISFQPRPYLTFVTHCRAVVFFA